MDTWSTHVLSTTLLTTTYELFRELVNSAFLEAALPYELTAALDDPSRLNGEPHLPHDVYERHYHIFRGRERIVSLDAAWHEDDGLVNFSFVLTPPELFKERAARKAFAAHVKPYVEERAGWDLWSEVHPDHYVLIDNNASLAVGVAFHPGSPFMFGLSLTDTTHSDVTEEWLLSLIEGSSD